MNALLLALALTQAAPAPRQAAADTTQGRRCRLAIDSVGREGRQITLASGQSRYFAGGGVWGRCQGTNTTFEADSVAWYSDQNRLDMIKDVHIRDSLIWLDANIANYFTRAERFEASGNVTALNRRTRSTLKGPNLTYWRAAAGVRDTAESYATGRPAITYYADTLSGSEPYIIVGDRMRFRGDDRMWGGGRVTIDRSDLTARGDSMQLDQIAGFGLLVGGAPTLEGKTGRSYALTGERIEFDLRQKEIERIRAFGTARGTGSGWALAADTIHLFLKERKIQGAIAWGTRNRAHAISSSTELEADSMAFDVPNEVLTQVRAFRRALSTMKDTTRTEAEVDWIAGDSLVANFEEAVDSTGERRNRVTGLVARGSARAFYHGFDDAQPEAPPSINYSRGRVITVTMGPSRVSRVTVSGQTDGVHLEPLPPVPAAAADTTKPAPSTPSRPPRP
ncbi:MAG: hypothetical protein ACREN5_15690 [Gemmatimonadales bacterium]